MRVHRHGGHQLHLLRGRPPPAAAALSANRARGRGCRERCRRPLAVAEAAARRRRRRRRSRPGRFRRRRRRRVDHRHRRLGDAPRVARGAAARGSTCTIRMSSRPGGDLRPSRLPRANAEQFVGLALGRHREVHADARAPLERLQRQQPLAARSDAVVIVAEHQALSLVCRRIASSSSQRRGRPTSKRGGAVCGSRRYDTEADRQLREHAVGPRALNFLPRREALHTSRESMLHTSQAIQSAMRSALLFVLRRRLLGALLLPRTAPASASTVRMSASGARRSPRVRRSGRARAVRSPRVMMPSRPPAGRV